MANFKTTKNPVAEILEEKKINITKGVDENGELFQNQEGYTADTVHELMQEIQEKKKKQTPTKLAKLTR